MSVHRLEHRMALQPADIVVDRLTKTYGAFTAVDNISFEVPRGTIVGFLGPNGAGKTTTIRMLTCYMPPTSGSAKVAESATRWRFGAIACSRARLSASKSPRLPVAKAWTSSITIRFSVPNSSKLSS